MLCLTIRQPWAWAIFYGKDIENRDWPTRVRGRVAIHTSAGVTRAEYREARNFCAALGVHPPEWSMLLRGYILGTVEIIDCVSSSDSPWFMGKYGFVFRNPQPLGEPIQARGQLGFWQPDTLTEMAIKRQQIQAVVL